MRLHGLHARLVLALAVVLLGGLLGGLLAATPATAGDGIEDYPEYQPATRCAPAAKPGTEELGHWMVRRFGGAFGSISRRCGGSVSEHTEGRAFDWTTSARTQAGRERAKAFLDRIRETDAHGNEDALARRMGIMYVIWNDHMYAAWNQYRPEPYLSSSCRSKRRCSQTLRHRDHVHVSLTRKAARAQTSWFVRRASRVSS